MDFDVSDAFFSMSAGILLVSSFYFNHKACKWPHPPGPTCLMKILISSYNLISNWRLKKKMLSFCNGKDVMTFHWFVFSQCYCTHHFKFWAKCNHNVVFVAATLSRLPWVNQWWSMVHHCLQTWHKLVPAVMTRSSLLTLILYLPATISVCQR